MDIQKQEGGDNSQNIQINGNLTCGISYSEARQIALDVFNANCQTLMREAAHTAEIRANEIIEDFVKKLFDGFPELSIRLKEPAIQYSVFSVIKNFVKTGDSDMKDRLLEMLIHRMQAKERSMEQIVMDEAIEVIPKITQEQIDVLSLILSAVCLNHRILNINDLHAFLNNKLLPFYSSHKSNSIYTHLQYTGCCTHLAEASTYKPYIEILKGRYSGLFNKGFSEETLEQTFGDEYKSLLPILTRCQQNQTLLQFNAMNKEVLENEIKKHGLLRFSDKILDLNRRNEMNNEEIKLFLCSSHLNMSSFLNEWTRERSGLKSIELTPVGYAIAVFNYNLKTGEKLLLKDFV